MTTSKEVVAEIDKLTEQGRATREIIDIIYENYNENIAYRQMRRLMTGARGNAVRDKPKLDYLNSNGKGERIKINNRQEAYREQLKINQDGSQEHATVIQMKAGQDKDVNFVLRAHGYDPAEWKIVSVINNFWQQGSSENGTRDLYQSKINVKPIEDIPIDKIVEEISKEVVPFKTKNVVNDCENNMIFPLADMHFGVTKLSDLASHMNKIVDIIKQPHNIFVIEQLGDLFHSSQMLSSQTLKGTMLDEVDMVQAIEDAKTFFDTIVKNINANKIIIKQMSGNHSGNMEYVFMEYLKAKYPNVEIENNIKYRDAYLLGKVGIMIAHGDYAKKGLPMLFANEYSKVWYKSNQRFIHSGHFHSQKETDDGGVIWRQFSTIKPNDKYEISNGWTMSKKTLYLLEYTNEELLSEYYV